MATGLAIEAPGRTRGNTNLDRTQRTSQLAPREAVAAPLINRTDPAADVAEPVRSASRGYRRGGHWHYGLVDGIVTAGAIAGFATALASMTGEWAVAQVASLTQAIVAKAAPATAPTVATGPTIESCAGSGPLCNLQGAGHDL